MSVLKLYNKLLPEKNDIKEECGNQKWKKEEVKREYVKPLTSVLSLSKCVLLMNASKYIV